MNQFAWVVLAVILAVLLDIYVVRGLRRYRQVKQAHEEAGISISRRELLKAVMISEGSRGFFVSLRNGLLV